MGRGYDSLTCFHSVLIIGLDFPGVLEQFHLTLLFPHSFRSSESGREQCSESRAESHMAAIPPFSLQS